MRIYKKTNHNSSAGFTLIELLVVVAIIGILASVVLASLNTARSKGIDARRLSDMNSLQKAIALYQSNNNGNFPEAVPDRGDGFAQSFGNATTFMNNLVTDGDMPTVIVDPLNTSVYQSYYYRKANYGSCPSGTLAVLHFYMTTIARLPYIACSTQGTSEGTYGWCLCLN